MTLFYVHSRLTVPTLSLLLDAPMVPILKTLHRLVVESSHSRTQVSTHRRTLLSTARERDPRTAPPGVRGHFTNQIIQKPDFTLM